MRYFIEASYDGRDFVGWQIQPEGRSVQGVIQDALSTVLRTPVEVVGCGRTDAGVHAQKYVFHVDVAEQLPDEFCDRLNRFLPEDIAFYRHFRVGDDAHARFSAVSRTYNYYLTFIKNPLGRYTSAYVPHADRIQWERVYSASELLMQYEAFRPFARTGSDTPHFLCSDLRLDWNIGSNAAVLTISANRFLRGMVRLMVGALLRVGKGDLDTRELRLAMEGQTALQKAASAPAHGLHLVEIVYDFEKPATGSVPDQS